MKYYLGQLFFLFFYFLFLFDHGTVDKCDLFDQRSKMYFPLVKNIYKNNLYLISLIKIRKKHIEDIIK